MTASRPVHRGKLFDHINGEAELYFPYGSIPSQRPDTSGKRHRALKSRRMSTGWLPARCLRDLVQLPQGDTAGCALGTDCVCRLRRCFLPGPVFREAAGHRDADTAQETFIACGVPFHRNTAGQRPPRRTRAPSSAGVGQDGAYLPQSVLGYPFFRRGLTAEGEPHGQQAQVFVVIEDSGRCRRSLRSIPRLPEGIRRDAKLTGKGPVSLDGSDPLYGKVMSNSRAAI